MATKPRKQTATLPHRGSSHRFYGNKQKRAGVSRLPLAFQKQILLNVNYCASAIPYLNYYLSLRFEQSKRVGGGCRLRRCGLGLLSFGCLLTRRAIIQDQRLRSNSANTSYISQTTLPHRGSSHRFYGNKQKRAGVSRLPLAFQKQIL